MLLQMYINDELIDSIEFNPSLLGMIKIYQMELEERNNDIIDLAKSEPTFFLEGIHSRMDNEIVPQKIIYN